MKKIVILLFAFAVLLGSISFGSARVNAAPPINYMDPGGGPSYTLVYSEYKTFDNSYVYSAIFSAVTFIVTKKVPALEAKSVGGSVATGLVTQWIQNKLGLGNTYVQVRQGISYNTYYKMYTYVESVIWYTNNSYITPIDVYYSDTLVRVPDDVLALHGLKNP
ncbi:hypothetical protein E5161_18710 [Cohnella pontilimi]|uniref:Uncharacterized protein n=1 Tax=Cohnella pontilimi TaxID=2564100 RepID=A0A4U0F4V5_9BACL|nr:hypothetical protein [Cohnella pontilimi]TJY39606.1 hypothetical protein E5161_18710 [Cohnella pontilimi]